jgi:hypothetical protein
MLTPPMCRLDFKVRSVFQLSLCVELPQLCTCAHALNHMTVNTKALCHIYIYIYLVNSVWNFSYFSTSNNRTSRLSFNHLHTCMSILCVRERYIVWQEHSTVLQCAHTLTSHLMTEQTKGCAFGDGMKDDLFLCTPWITFHNFKVMAVMMCVYFCLCYSATV